MACPNSKTDPFRDVDLSSLNPWGVPDWRKSDKYPTRYEELTSDQWDWEFIRRSETYRTVWMEMQEARTLNPNDAQTIYNSYNQRTQMQFETNLIGPQYDSQKRCVKPLLGRSNPFFEYLNSFSPLIDLNKIHPEELEHFLHAVKEERLLLACIDTNQPIHQQLENINSRLAKFKPSGSRSTRKKLPETLRLIDADLAFKTKIAKRQHIADIFTNGNSSNASRKCNRALEVQMDILNGNHL